MAFLANCDSRLLVQITDLDISIRIVAEMTTYTSRGTLIDRLPAREKDMKVIAEVLFLDARFMALETICIWIRFLQRRRLRIVAAEIGNQICGTRHQTTIAPDQAGSRMAIDTAGLSFDIMSTCQVHRRRGSGAVIKRLLALRMTRSAKPIMVFKLHGGNWNNYAK